MRVALATRAAILLAAILLPIAAHAADVKTALAAPRARIESADYRASGHLIRVQANGIRTSFPITIKAHWFPGVLRVFIEAASPANERVHVLLEMHPGGKNTILIAHPGDTAAAALPFDKWSDGPLGEQFSYEDFMEAPYFWAGQTSLGQAKYGSRTCDLVLSDPDVSRRHLRVFQMQDSPWAIDLGSANGVLVDGDGATRTRLQAGSRLWLGSVELEVRQAPGELPAALRQAWSALVDSPASALRDLAGAVACSVRQDGTYDFLWAEVGQCLDDLGPLRRCLLEAALEAVAR